MKGSVFGKDLLGSLGILCGKTVNNIVSDF